MRIAFPMYDRPETAPALDRFHEALRGALAARSITSEPQRARPSDLLSFWQSPDLLIAQTCAFPLRAKLADHVTVLGASDHRLAGIAPGCYASVIIARSALDPADLPQRKLAINDRLSQSGYAAPLAWLEAQGLAAPRIVTESGAHRASAQMVAEGQADWAAIDAVTWQLIQAYDPFAAPLQVLAHTQPSPALPFITAKGRELEPLRAALAEAVAGMDPADQAMLRLFEFIPRCDADYLVTS